MTADTTRHSETVSKLVRFAAVLFCAAALCSVISACASDASISTGLNRPKVEARGFFDKLTDELSERECNVGRFTCPYGLGPAGEPCDCTDPNGVVLTGRTIK